MLLEVLFQATSVPELITPHLYHVRNVVDNVVVIYQNRAYPEMAI